MPDSLKHYSITVSGRVQGVGFRYSAINAARSFGIKGFVKNNPDRSVYLEIEGTELQTDLMLEWCRKGPGTARVDNISVYEGTVKGFTTFKVRY